MHRFRSPGTVRSWGVLLGVLMALGPVLHSVAAAPCEQAPPSAPVTVEVAAPDAPGAQTCTAQAPHQEARAVSTDRVLFVPDAPESDAASGASLRGRPPESSSAERPGTPRIAPPLCALQMVVLQI